MLYPRKPGLSENVSFLIFHQKKEIGNENVVFLLELLMNSDIIKLIYS